jgi:hypothetical protein
MLFPPPAKKKPLRFTHVVYMLMMLFVLFVLYQAGGDERVHRPLPSQGDHDISGRVAEYRRKMEQWVEDHPTEEQRHQRAEQLKAALSNSLARVWG